MSLVCYNPIKGIDDVIASKVKSLNPWMVASLRGLYDEKHEEKLDTSDLDKAANSLLTFRKEISKSNYNSFISSSSNLAEAHKKVKKVFTPEELHARVSMIATSFSAMIDSYRSKNPYSRKELCQGFTVNGVRKAGEMALFENVYNGLLQQREAFWVNKNTEAVAKIDKVLENWGVLVSYARRQIKDTEDILLGNDVEYADDTNMDNFGDNDVSQLFSAEESTREAWQNTSDMQSAVGSLGKQVKRILGRIQLIENGVRQYDDLNFPVMLDPIKAYQSLSDMLRGITSESQMIGLMKEAAKHQEWLNPVITTLEKDDILRTEFYVNMKTNFQPYSDIQKTEDKHTGVKTFKTRIRNKIENALSRHYLTRIALGKPLNEKTSIYNSDGSINWSNLQEVRNLINTIIPSKEKTIAPKFNSYSWQEKKQFLIRITEAIGIDIDGNTLDAIMANKGDLSRFVTNLTEFISFGVEKILDKSNLDSLDSKDFSKLPKTRYKNLFRAKTASNHSKEGNIEEKINKVLAIITKHREGIRLEKKCTYKDKNGNTISLFSNVKPSYLGDEIDKINSFVSNGDRNGLRKYLEGKYINTSSFFKYNGKILNRWLRDLYEEGLGENEFPANFKYKRFLGSDEINFEDFTSKQHAIDMMNEYFSERQISAKSNYAWYPVFILGDSGVAKYIKAKRYSAKDIQEGLYDVYVQEKRRMELTKAMVKKMNPQAVEKVEMNGQEEEIINWDKVTVKVDNFTDNFDKFTMLPFLNRDFKADDGTIGKYAKIMGNNPSQQEVTKAITAYMNDATESFKNKLENLGLLETKEVYNFQTNKKEKVYEYFSQEVKGDMTIDKVIADFYWNTKFATIQQLQMMTIDPAFYKGTKDLQKRYKEIHAPGNILSLEAKDANGNYYNPLDEYGNPQPERCVYFEDIDLNAEDINASFMEAIAYQYGKKLAKPGDSREEIIRLGKTTKVYEAYTKNTLTDGQGYRTLDGYRKVMGMAGKWTDEMQKAYDEIKSLRNKYGRDGNIPTAELERISNLSIVFQPIKPYMFTHERYAISDTETMLIPVQHKYAEAVLIPELLPAGSKLRDMAYWMEDHKDENDNPAPIDLIGSTKIVKVGGFGATNIKGIRDSQELSNALDKAYVHQLNYGDYRIQTNVPEHINSSQLFGTQVRKLIMANILMDDYHYESYTDGNRVNLGKGRENSRINGRNLVHFYNALITANILDSYENFENNVTDIKDLSKALLQSTVNNSRESMDNLLAYSLTGDDKFLVPLFEGALEHDSAALIFSMFKRKVNKQKIKGGSAVQVSAMGIKGYEESGDLEYIVDSNNKDNILYAECEIPWDLSVQNADKTVTPLKFDDWCNEDGTLKLGKEIDESDSRYKICQSFKDSEGKVHVPLIEETYPNILSILAYRIPTERDYSMINLRVKRFSQKTAGGTIKVPAQGTTIAGFDFDIDKLYFMMNEYRMKYKYLESAISNEDKNRIFAWIYEQRPDIKSGLESSRMADDPQGLGLASLNSYWGQDSVTAYEDKNKLFEDAAKALGIDISKSKIEYLDTYDYSKSPLNNSSAARNNMLIHLIQNRLMDEETFEQRYTPGGFANASKAARTMRELLFGNLDGIVSNGEIDFSAINARAKDKSSDPEPNYDPSDPWTIITYNQQNQVAGKLIGIFANQNTNHAFASLMNTFKLRNPIKFAGHSYDDLLHAPEGVNVDLNVAEFLAASVDAVKDPSLNFLNLNTITADSGAVLARIGYSMQEIGLLFNQPIIKELCEYYFNNNMNYIDSAIRQIAHKYLGKEESIKGDTSKAFDANTLAMNIVKYRQEGSKSMEDEAFRMQQLQVLSLFSEIQKVAGDVSQFVTSSKFTASNAVGSTFGDLYAQQMKVQNYLKKFRRNQKGETSLSVEMRVTDLIEAPINDDSDNLTLNKEEYMERVIENPLAYEQAMYDMNRRARGLLNRYYPYDTKAYSKARNGIASLTRSGYLNADDINRIHNDLIVYIMSQQEQSDFNGELFKAEINGKKYSNREYYTDYFAKAMFNYLEDHPELKELSIFKYMQFNSEEVTNRVTGEVTDKVTMNIQGIGGLAPYQKDEIKDSWAELLKNPSTAPLATDLFLYNYYKLGFTFSPTAFMNLCPTEVKQVIKAGNGKSYLEFLQDVQEGKVDINQNDFCQQFILNHTDNKKLVYTPFGDTYKSLKKKVYVNSVLQPFFEIDVEKLGEDAKDFIISDDTIDPKKQTAFRPCIIIDDVIYMCQAEGTDKFNVCNGSVMTYVKVGKLGVTNKSLQYISNFENDSLGVPESDSELQGNTGGTPEIVPDAKPFDRNSVIKEIAREQVAATKKYGFKDEQGMDFTENSIIIGLSEESDSKLNEMVTEIRNAAREDGVMILDEKGNTKPAC